MKKISKIFSLVLAVCFIASCFSVNVMAASTARTVTINVDKTEALAASDVVTIELTLDETQNLTAMEYKLAYDTAAFEVDMIEEAYQDADWYTEITAMGGSKNKKFADYLGTPTYAPVWDWDNGVLLSPGEEGKINFSWAGSTAIAAAKNETDKVIGKFYIKVKANAANGKYTFSLTGNTMDGGENSKADMVCTPVTVTVGSGEPDPTPTDTNIAEDFSSNEKLSPDGYYAGAEEITSGTVSYGDYSAEMGANGKVHTFFAKTVDGVKALEYGVKATIKVNGTETVYKFPGKADVGANQAWAIKIIIPNGTFADKTTTAEITKMEKY